MAKHNSSCSKYTYMYTCSKSPLTISSLKDSILWEIVNDYRSASQLMTNYEKLHSVTYLLYLNKHSCCNTSTFREGKKKSPWGLFYYRCVVLLGTTSKFNSCHPFWNRVTKADGAGRYAIHRQPPPIDPSLSFKSKQPTSKNEKYPTEAITLSETFTTSLRNLYLKVGGRGMLVD